MYGDDWTEFAAQASQVCFEVNGGCPKPFDGVDYGQPTWPWRESRLALQGKQGFD